MPTESVRDDFAGLSMGQIIERLHAAPDTGLSAEQVQAKCLQYGFNEIPHHRRNDLLLFLQKFWGLSAWMIEAIIVLSFVLGKWADFYVSLGLLLANALIGFFQESRAQHVVEMLESKLQIQARVLRGGTWTSAPARELVPGDVIRLRMGDLVPADVRILAGGIRVDQSSLTGETQEQTRRVGDEVYSASIVRDGECQGLVVFTGRRTLFGKTVELVAATQPRLHMEDVVAGLVRWLFAIVGFVVVLLLIAAWLRGTPIGEILALSLVLLMGAVPVALPVMFSVSTALGARTLGRQGVLVTRLSATEDAATMEILCVDKTGTITLNELAVAEILPHTGLTAPEVLLHAALASNASNRDAIDSAILTAAHKQNLATDAYRQQTFIPFTPATRRTEALIVGPTGGFTAIKGALNTLCALAKLSEEERRGYEKSADALAEKGLRSLAVARTAQGKTEILGLIALHDPPRPDSRQLISRLQELGVRVKMLTGDATPVAQQIASEVGLKVIRNMKELRAKKLEAREWIETINRLDGLAEVFPEDKHAVIKALQDAGKVVGMTGDGVNDAPALQTAEVGVAVKGATDAARSAASVVLTDSGLTGIVDLVKNGRSVYQRILTWMINKVSSTVLKTGFVGISYLLTGQILISALGMIVLVFMTDFIKIALATDHVRPSPRPDSWEVRPLVIVAAILGVIMLVEALALLWIGVKLIGLIPGSKELDTFSFLVLLFMALMSLLSIRERGPFWKSRPSGTLLLATLGSGLAGTLIGCCGIGDLHALPPVAILIAFGSAIGLTFGINDPLKLLLLRWV